MPSAEQLSQVQDASMCKNAALLEHGGKNPDFLIYLDLNGQPWSFSEFSAYSAFRIVACHLQTLCRPETRLCVLV